MAADDLPAPVPAATLVLIRDRAAAAPELLFVERAPAMAFAGGALVWPGGRIDAGDEALALRDLPGDPEGAARIAAIRETLEEAGIAVGLVPPPAPAAAARVREGLHSRAPFAALLAAEGLRVAGEALTLFARWCPRHAGMRIFDTRFFLARCPAEAPAPVVDGTENVRAFWASAEAVLAAAAAGEATVIFPTRRNLERLAAFRDFGAALADAHAHPVVTVTPWIEPRDGRDHLCIPEGIGYPITAEALADTRRG